MQLIKAVSQDDTSASDRFYAERKPTPATDNTRLDGARELDQETVAGGLDDATTVLADLGADELAPDRLEAGEGALLVLPHKAAVARDVRREDGRQPSPHAGRTSDPPETAIISQSGMEHQTGPKAARERPSARGARCTVPG